LKLPAICSAGNALARRFKKWCIPVLAGFWGATVLFCLKSPARWYEGFVFTNGIRLHFLRSGCSKPALIYAHDSGENAWSGQGMAENFRRDFDVFLYDARGHGLSGETDSLCSIEQHVEDLYGLIRQLPVDSPVCMGRGIGAATACWLSALHPGSTRALILIDPHGLTNPPEPCTLRPEGGEVEGAASGPGLFEAFQRISCPVLIVFSSDSSASPLLHEETFRCDAFSNIQMVICKTAFDRSALKAIRLFLQFHLPSLKENLPVGR